MTSRDDICFAYAAYIQARIDSAPSEAERAKLSLLLEEALKEMITDLLSEWTVSG